MNATLRLRALGLAAALSIVAGYEGLRNYAYVDPVGVWTICYGHTAGVRPGDYKPTGECQALLGEEYLRAVEQVQRCVWTPLTVGQLAAFADLVYNIGPYTVCDARRSTLARHLRAGHPLAACAELTRWIKGRVAGVLVTLPGLVRRRTEFRAICEDPAWAG